MAVNPVTGTGYRVPGIAAPSLTRLRAAFFGTPELAATVLQRALGSDVVEVVAVVTQPDRPVGRRQVVQPPPAKVVAQAAGVPVLQPRRASHPAFQQQFRELGCDVALVAAYGQKLPAAMLAVPPLRFLNVHASLLPRHRGAAPVAAAILAGERETGVSIMLVEETLDTGPVLARCPEPIRDDDTTTTLTARLAVIGADLLLATLPGWARGEIQPEPQDPALATYDPPVRKQDARIDWSRPAAAIERAVRAYQPWPVAFTSWRGRLLKVLEASLGPPVAGPPGRVHLLEGRRVAVATGQGSLLLCRLQLAGGRPQPALDLLRGHRLAGEVLGAEAP